MSVYIVTYDLNSPGQNYQPLIKAIESYTHCKCLKSAYFIDTSETTASVCDKLMRLIDGNDALYVMDLKFHWAANRVMPCTEWLKSPARTWG